MPTAVPGGMLLPNGMPLPPGFANGNFARANPNQGPKTKPEEPSKEGAKASPARSKEKSNEEILERMHKAAEKFKAELEEQMLELSRPLSVRSAGADSSVTLGSQSAHDNSYSHGHHPPSVSSGISVRNSAYGYGSRPSSTVHAHTRRNSFVNGTTGSSIDERQVSKSSGAHRPGLSDAKWYLLVDSKGKRYGYQQILMFNHEIRAYASGMSAGGASGGGAGSLLLRSPPGLEGLGQNHKTTQSQTAASASSGGQGMAPPLPVGFEQTLLAAASLTSKSKSTSGNTPADTGSAPQEVVAAAHRPGFADEASVFAGNHSVFPLNLPSNTILYQIIRPYAVARCNSPPRGQTVTAKSIGESEDKFAQLSKDSPIFEFEVEAQRQLARAQAQEAAGAAGAAAPTGASEAGGEVVAEMKNETQSAGVNLGVHGQNHQNATTTSDNFADFLVREGNWENQYTADNGIIHPSQVMNVNAKSTTAAFTGLPSPGQIGERRNSSSLHAANPAAANANLLANPANPVQFAQHQHEQAGHGGRTRPSPLDNFALSSLSPAAAVGQPDSCRSHRSYEGDHSSVGDHTHTREGPATGQAHSQPGSTISMIAPCAPYNLYSNVCSTQYDQSYNQHQHQQQYTERRVIAKTADEPKGSWRTVKTSHFLHILNKDGFCFVSKGFLL